MLSWSAKKKINIISSLLLLLIFGLIIVWFFFIKEKPNCFDNVKNGDEEGIDCGGKCVEVCTFHATTVNTLWAKAFPVTNGVYNIVAILENSNFDYKLKTDYTLKAYNKKGVLTYQYYNTIELLPAEKRAIFLPSVLSKSEKISKIFVEYTNMKSLLRADKQTDIISITSRRLSEEFDQTKLTINLKNNSLKPLRKIEVVAILYDDTNNAIQAGKTFIDYLNKREEKKVFMTWPDSISNQVNVIEIFTKELKTTNY